jgi:hypothetical protein
MAMTAAERSTRARIGALTLHSQHDSAALTERARQVFLASFEILVDPEGQLSEHERRRRAGYARRAHMAKLSLKAARARSAKARSRNTSC